MKLNFYFLPYFQVPWTFTFGQTNSWSWRANSPNLFKISFAKIIKAHLSLLSSPFPTSQTFWRGKNLKLQYLYKYCNLYICLSLRPSVRHNLWFQMSAVVSQSAPFKSCLVSVEREKYEFSVTLRPPGFMSGGKVELCTWQY